MKNIKFIYLALVCVLIGCAQKSKIQSFETHAGIPFMIYSKTFEEPLFTLSESDKIGGFAQWVRSYFNYNRMQCDVNNFEVIPNIDSISRIKKVSALNLIQNYRGFQVLGPSTTINLSLVNNNEVFAINGSIIDQSIEFKGMGDKLPLETIIAKVNQSLKTDFNTKSLNGNYTIGYFAYPELKQMVYKIRVKRSGFNSDIVYFIAADNGEILAKEVLTYNDVTVDWPIVVSAKAFDNQLDDAQLQASQLMIGSISTGDTARLGNARLVVYDLHGTENSPNIILRSALRSSGGSGVGIGREPFFAPLFSGQNEDERRAINVFHKLTAGINWVESIRIASLSYPENSPLNGTNELPPLIVLANIDTDNPNTYFTDSIRFPVPPEEPNFIYDGTDYELGVIEISRINRVNVLFHELGHFYDQYLALGILGDDYLSNTCTPDTHDESKPLRETSAQLFAMCLIRQLYPDLPYDLSTTSSNCNLRGVVGFGSTIHSSNCSPIIAQFEQNRPSSPSGETGCTVRPGYLQYAIHQAFWEFISGQQCDPNPPFSCTQTNANSEMALEAMVHVLQGGNHASYQQFFNMMRFYFIHEFGTEIDDIFVDIFEHHGFEFGTS